MDSSARGWWGLVWTPVRGRPYEMGVQSTLVIAVGARIHGWGALGSEPDFTLAAWGVTADHCSGSTRTQAERRHAGGGFCAAETVWPRLPLHWGMSGLAVYCAGERADLRPLRQGRRRSIRLCP